MSLKCRLFGVPNQCGANQPGCLMGPDAFRTTGIVPILRELGHDVLDVGNVCPDDTETIIHRNNAIHDLGRTVAWAGALRAAARKAVLASEFPVFLGGDHSLSIGTVPGVTLAAHELDRPQFVLWLDAHSDFHTLESTTSGNLHGTPMAYCTGRKGFEGYYPKLEAVVSDQQVCMMGIRSVDNAERSALRSSQVRVYDMRALDESGVVKPLREFTNEVKAANGMLHVSLDVDFLDPEIAPAVGTTVPGGATFREAHLIMELLCDSRVVTSIDLVELNPFLDERGKTAMLMVDLLASLLGRKVLDRRTRSY